MVRRRVHRNESLGGLQWQYNTQDKNRLHSSNRSIFFWPEARAISTIAQDHINNRSPHAQFLSTHRSVRLQFARLYGSSNGSASREIRFLYARPRMRDILAAELRLTWQFFFYGTRSRSSSERACWIGDVRSVFVFCFCFPMFVYQVKTVPHKPLYMTSTYNSKTAVQYHMTPIYNSTLITVQYRTITDPLL